jgi:transcriptional regulator with XRE-family HTH domain
MNQNTPESFDDFLADAEKRDTYWEELAILEFTEALVARLESLSLSKSEWAKRLNINPSQVTKLLAGENNFTLRTMVKLARSLGCELTAGLRPEADSVQSYVAYHSGSILVPLLSSFERPEQPATRWSGELTLEDHEASALAA